jgi:O-acetyl-ADP-ribose deacetylase
VSLLSRHGVALEVRRGDIADQPDLEAVVNAANAALAPGGGVAGAIHAKAGPGLYEECRKLAPIRPGEAVITGGHGLSNRWVIHCLGPVFGADEPAAALLGACYAHALELARERAIRSIGFPAISTGIFGYPAAEAARVAWGTILARLPAPGPLLLIRFVLFSEAERLLHEQVLAELARAPCPER